ncbi:hypothetical protein [Brachybacterium hainanense]|uniref:Uncharacterized protein n=1 Tax=Brachybacterium hainanense TaxID=1541174 RepID=A0ABV6RFH0_9MICO
MGSVNVITLTHDSARTKLCELRQQLGMPEREARALDQAAALDEDRLELLRRIDELTWLLSDDG